MRKWRTAAYRPQIFGYRFRIHSTKLSGAAIVERRLWRTSDQSLNLPDSLISLRVTGGSSLLRNYSSTTVSFGFFASGRGSETTWARPTMAASLMLW
jgi:hypothetical protein